MKRLRHPIRAIREPFGTAGLIVAMVALVAALGGSALAAKGALTGKQKKEVEKIAKKFAGKPGAPGATGPAGPAGAAGKAGANGTNGTNGKDGTNGTNGSPGSPGAPGKSVTVTPIATAEPTCEGEGGARLEEEEEPASEVQICNGKEGSPWTAGGVLPPGKTETGTWAFNAASGDGANILVPISFSIPLASGLEEEEVHFQGATQEEREKEENEEPTKFTESCRVGGKGTAGTPQAQPGQLCIYNNYIFEPETALVNATFTNVYTAISTAEPVGAGLSGSILRFAFSGAPGEVARGYGSWAVTAPAAP